jgi:nucleotide-binding universal stress UspA family protein
MKILAALDLASTTPAVLDAARKWAVGLGAKLWLVHAAAPNPDFVGYETGPDTVRDAIAHQLRVQRTQLEEAAEVLRKDGIEVIALIVQGPTAETILHEADKIGADLLLMGTRGHGKIHDWLVGSTSKGVLHSTTRPVLLIPPPPEPEA